MSQRFIIGGRIYEVGDEGVLFPGFGGRQFTIVTNDGREITTTNLWCGGDTSEPDNAKFKHGERWQRVGRDGTMAFG